MEIPRNIPQKKANHRSLAEGVHDRKSATLHAATLEIRCYAATPIGMVRAIHGDFWSLSYSVDLT